MQLNLDPMAQGNLITGFSVVDRGFELRIGDSLISDSIIITAEAVVPWEVATFEQLHQDHFRMLAELDTEVLLLGTGSRIQFPSAGLTRPLTDQQIGVEVMDTAAACRTYNILRGDGRSVAAALILDKS